MYKSQDFCTMTAVFHQLKTCGRGNPFSGQMTSEVTWERNPKMALEERRKFLWHAFNALDEQKSGTVQKSQLKVISVVSTQHFGRLLRNVMSVL